jgi:outer membrane cobalamin receptor
VAAYSQAIWQSDIANFTLGGRYYKHNVFGDSFVPRFAVTKVLGGLHLKGLWSKAFRAPGIKNIDINTEIKPEKTTVFEGEVGYALTHELSAVFNAFSTSIEDPIIYYTNEAEEDSYDNFEKTGSKGVELALKWKTAHSRSDLSYSFYTNNGMNAVEKYVVEDGEGPTLGAAQHKIAWHGDTDLSANWNVGANLVYLGKNYSFEVSEDPADQADGVGTQVALDPVYLVDLVMTYKNLGIQGLDLSAGVYNILDQDYRFVQPYDGGQSAMPSLDREGVIRVSYTKQF